MAELQITGATLIGGNPITDILPAAEAVGIGQMCARDANAKWALSLADTAENAGANGYGFALPPGPVVLDDPLLVVRHGAILKLAFSAGSLEVGKFYFMSGVNPGGICRENDLLSTQYPTLLGYSRTVDELVMSQVRTGIALP